MAGITELGQLLASLQPELQDGEYVFCTVDGPHSEYVHLDPLATFREAEGLTLVLREAAAREAGLPFEGTFRRITLTVHSSLHAVGLTAAVAGRLTEDGISANVVAAYHHDHVFVPSERAVEAMTVLEALSADCHRGGLRRS